MNAVTLSSKYQVSIPKDIREALDLKPGQKLVFLNTGTSIKLMRQPTIDDVIGLGSGADTENYRDRDERRETILPKSAPKLSGGRRSR